MEATIDKTAQIGNHQRDRSYSDANHDHAALYLNSNTNPSHYNQSIDPTDMTIEVDSYSSANTSKEEKEDNMSITGNNHSSRHRQQNTGNNGRRSKSCEARPPHRHSQKRKYPTQHKLIPCHPASASGPLKHGGRISPKLTPSKYRGNKWIRKEHHGVDDLSFSSPTFYQYQTYSLEDEMMMDASFDAYKQYQYHQPPSSNTTTRIIFGESGKPIQPRRNASLQDHGALRHDYFSWMNWTRSSMNFKNTKREGCESTVFP